MANKNKRTAVQCAHMCAHFLGSFASRTKSRAQAHTPTVFTLMVGNIHSPVSHQEGCTPPR